MKAKLPFFLGVIILLLIGLAGGWYLGKGSPKNTTNLAPSPQVWKTYTNTQHNYSIEYPADWTVRKIIPDTETGAAFQPANKPKDYQYEYITIEFGRKITSDAKNIPFEEYVKTAASNEIQGYGDLLSIEKVTTSSNITGYKTTWSVSPPPGAGGGTSPSLPITYFPAPGDGVGIIRVSLSSDSAMDTYNKMLLTFKEY